MRYFMHANHARKQYVSSATPTVVPGGERILPTRGFPWQEFDEFTERPLGAHRFCNGQVSNDIPNVSGDLYDA